MAAHPGSEQSIFVHTIAQLAVCKAGVDGRFLHTPLQSWPAGVHIQRSAIFALTPV